MVANIAKEIAKDTERVIVTTQQERILLTTLGLLLKRECAGLGQEAEECLLGNLLRQAKAMVDAEDSKCRDNYNRDRESKNAAL